MSAASGRTVVLAIAYAAGSALVLLALTLGGRSVFERVRRAGRADLLQRAMGTVMILTAVAILTNLDVNFDQFVAEQIPDVNLTAGLECSHAVTSRLHEITGHKHEVRAGERLQRMRRILGARSPWRRRRRRRPPCWPTRASCRRSGWRPNSAETERWFNTPRRQPLSLQGLRGRVVLVDFWTYTCINCIRTLPYLKAWDAALPLRRA